MTLLKQVFKNITHKKVTNLSKLARGCFFLMVLNCLVGKTDSKIKNVFFLLMFFKKADEITLFLPIYNILICV